MPQKKENLPMNVDVDLENGGTITYANEVIAIIAGVAASEIDGIAGMCMSGVLSDILGKNRNVTRGVKVEIGSEEASVDLYVIVEYGQPIQKVASEVQENVRKAIESMTGLHVVRVDVHVQGVSFEKEKKANMKNLEEAHNPVLEAPQEEAQEMAQEQAQEPEQVQQPAEEPAEEFAEENAEEAPEQEYDEEVLAEEARLDAEAEECAREEEAGEDAQA